MQRIGHQLLAGAGLAGDQHRQRCLRQATDGTEQRAHRRRITHQLRRLVAMRFRRRCGRRQCRRNCRQHTLRQRHRVVQVERFGQEFMRATTERTGRAGHIGIGRHHDHRQLRQRGLELVQQHQAIVARHAHIGEQQRRRRAFAQGLQGSRSAVEIDNLVARLAQRGAQHEAHGTIVIDHPDALRGRRRLRHRAGPPRPGRCH